MPRTTVARVELRHFLPGTKEFEAAFDSALEDASFLLFPMLLGAAVVLPFLFHVWLDERWQDGIVPAQLTLIGTLPAILTYCSDVTFVAIRRSHIYARAATVQSLTTIAVTLLGVQFGLDALAAMLAVRAFVFLALPIYFLEQTCMLSMAAVLRPMRSPMAGALLMAAMVWLAGQWLPVIPGFGRPFAWSRWCSSAWRSMASMSSCSCAIA